MAFYDSVGTHGDSANPKKVIEKEKAEKKAVTAAKNAEEGTSGFSKDPNDGNMIKRY